MVKVTIKTIGLDVVNAKLLVAAPRILEQNRLMVTAMLKEIKPIVVAQTPLGPGHFGYHLRERFVTDVTSKGVVTTGELKSPRTGYWREYGTGIRYRGPKRKAFGVRILTGSVGTGGERAFETAHHAASGVKRLITFYYGGITAWWRS